MVPALKPHNCAKLTNTAMCLKTPGQTCLHHIYFHDSMDTVRDRNVVFQHWPLLWPWAIFFLLFPYLFSLSLQLEAPWARTMSHHRQDLEQGFSWHCSGANYPRSWLSNWGTVQIIVLVCPSHTQSAGLTWIRDYLICPHRPAADYKAKLLTFTFGLEHEQSGSEQNVPTLFCWSPL